MWTRRKGPFSISFTRRELARFLVIGAGFLLVVYFFFKEELLTFAFSQARGTRFESLVAKHLFTCHLSRSGGPAEKALADGKIVADDSVETIEAAYGPFAIIPLGRYHVIRPPRFPGIAFESYGMVAKDGRLVYATWWTCVGKVEFFNKLSSEEWDEVNQLYREDRDRREATRRAAQMAVAGPAATIEPWNLPQPDPPAETDHVHP